MEHHKWAFNEIVEFKCQKTQIRRKYRGEREGKEPKGKVMILNFCIVRNENKQKRVKEREKEQHRNWKTKKQNVGLFQEQK